MEARARTVTADLINKLGWRRPYSISAIGNAIETMSIGKEARGNYCREGLDRITRPDSGNRLYPYLAVRT